MAGPALAFQTGDHASRPAASAGCVLYSCTDHNLVYRSDGSSWTTLITLASGLSNPMTTAGDLIYSSDGSGTPARLAAGTDDQVLTLASGVPSWADASGGSGLATGTSFPGSPTTGDRYRRSDLDYLTFFYDGTRWVTEQIFTISQVMNDLTGTTRNRFAVRTDLSVWLERCEYGFRGATGGGNWSLRLESLDFEQDVTLIASQDVTGYTAGNMYSYSDALDTEVDMTGGNAANEPRAIAFQSLENSGADTVYTSITIYYRLIAT